MRLTDAQRRAYAVRERVEAEMQQAVAAELNWLYRRLQMKVRRINQFRPRVQSTAPTLRKSYVVSGDLWEEFRRRMHSSVMRAIVFGAIEIFNINRDFYSTVAPIEFSSDNFARLIEPEIGERIVNIESTLKREVGRKVVGWYNSPGTTMQSLINQLKENVFTDARARMIAQTEVTHLNSRVHENIANQIGATEWWWSTRNDQLVCKRPLPGPDGRGHKGCRELHGKVFKIGQLMPPYASHPNCRCTPIIITPKKQAEEPAKLIEELLAVRKGIHAGALLAGSLLKVDWEEQKHPRDEDGQFTSKGGGASGGYEVGQKISPQRGKDIYTIMGTGTHSGERTYLVRRAGASKGRYVTESELREKWSLSGEGSKPKTPDSTEKAGKPKPAPKQKWGAKGNVTPRVPPARPADISDNDKRLLREYKKHYKISDTDIPGVFARTQNTPEGTYYHLSREGIKSTAPTDLMNDIGSALYVGRDPAALKEFYGELQGVDDGEVFEFKADDLNILDAREIADFDKIKRDAKKEFPDEKFPVGAYARAHGYDALVYFDPWATGEEFAIFNKDKVTQTGRVSDSAKPEQKPQPAAKPTKGYLRKPKTASEISGRVPKRDGKPVPETTKRVFHVTKRENIEAILQNGFDLSRVNPRWGNDYAVSTTNAPLPKAMEYFMPYSKGAQFDNERYAVLQVTVKGRFYDYDTDQIPYRGQGLSPQGWTRAAVKDGWDGQAGANMYIYNPAAIMEIKEVDPGEVAAANEKLKRRVLKYTSLQELRKVDWQEDKHPRRQDGKFAPKGQGEAGGGKPDKPSQRLAAPLRMLAPDPDIDDLLEVKQWRQKHYQNAVHKIMTFALIARVNQNDMGDLLKEYGKNIADFMPPQKAYKEFLKGAHKVMDGKVDEKDLLRLENAIRVADWRYIKEFKTDGDGQPPQPPQPPKPEVKPPQPKPEPEAIKPPTAGNRKMGAQVAKELVSVINQMDIDEQGHYNRAGAKYPKAAAKYDAEMANADAYYWEHVHNSVGRVREENLWVYADMKNRAEKEWEAEKLRPPEALRPYLEVEKGKEVGYIKKDRKSLPAQMNENVDDAFAMLHHIFSDNVSLVHKRVSLRHEAGVRANCDNFIITLDKNDSPKTIVHEYGHYIEANNKYARREVKKFLRRRTKGEVAKKLNVLTNKNYGDHEEAKPDKFFNPYCGKIYPRGETEILSMGMQEYATDPIKFLKTDPEYFALIYDVLHGNFEPEPQPEVKKLRDMADLMKADWEEQKHPRDEDGKFTDKGTGVSGGSSKEPAHVKTDAYKEYADRVADYHGAKDWSEKAEAIRSIHSQVNTMRFNSYGTWEAMMKDFFGANKIPDTVTIYEMEGVNEGYGAKVYFTNKDDAEKYALENGHEKVDVVDIDTAYVSPFDKEKGLVLAEAWEGKNARRMKPGWKPNPEVVTYKHVDTQYTRNINMLFNQSHLPARVQDYADNNNGKKITGEEYVKRCEDYLKKTLSDTDIVVRLTPANLAGVLKDGAYKSVFETNRSGAGAFKGKKKGYYLGVRRDAERDMFGVPDKETGGRPVYGYITGKDDVKAGDKWHVGQFGSAAVVLKDGVRSRTTFTSGDSLDSGYSAGVYKYTLGDGTTVETGRCAPSPIDDPKATSVFWLDNRDWLSDVEAYQAGKMRDDNAWFVDPRADGLYWEAQVMGGFTLDDIKEVVFTEEPPQSTMDLLKKRGIVWRMEKGKEDE